MCSSFSFLFFVLATISKTHQISKKNKQTQTEEVKFQTIPDTYDKWLHDEFFKHSKPIR
jgi:hypothetical protein